MRKLNPKNERVKRRYFMFLQHAKQLSTKSVDQAAASITAFEQSTDWRDFEKFHIEQARKFKEGLTSATNARTGKPLSKATILSRLNDVKAFFFWLASEPGFRSKLKYSDCEYFNLSSNDRRIASAKGIKRVATLEQVQHVIATMPAHTEIERRDRAIVAFALLTGMRDDAIASIPLGGVDLEQRQVFQDARVVRTKFRKTILGQFFPVGNEVEQIVADWVAYLKTERGFVDADPLFPATEVGLGESGHFEALGLGKCFWSDASPIRKIFKTAFAAAGVPYSNPHTIRDTLVRLAESRCANAEEFKAWSQNLAHEDVLTTFRSYGEVPAHRQAEVMGQLNRRAADGSVPQGVPDRQTIKWVMEHVQSRVISGSG